MTTTTTWLYRLEQQQSQPREGSKIVVGMYSGEKLSYVEARKRIYIPLYSQAVQKTSAFAKLKILYQEGKDICLWDFDAHGLTPGTFDYWDLFNNEKIKVGHAYVLAMLLEGKIEDLETIRKRI